MWTGIKDGFKNIVDTFLTTIPDQPETSDCKPGGKILLGEASNSVPDWMRVLSLEDEDDDDNGDDVCHDDIDDHVLDDDGRTSTVNAPTSLLGSGLS